MKNIIRKIAIIPNISQPGGLKKSIKGIAEIQELITLEVGWQEGWPTIIKGR